MDVIPLTPYRLMLLLAYCQHYTPRFLPARCLSATHLRRLALWLDQPAPRLRTARDHPLLAAHLVVAHSAGLLTAAGGHWHLAPAALDWLAADRLTQIESLRLACVDEAAWQAAADTLGLRHTFNLAFPAFLAQQLARLAQSPPPDPQLAVWLEPAGDDVWRLRLPAHLPLPLHFHLLQIGDWAETGKPPDLWTGSGYAIAAAAQRGYSPLRIEAILTAATDTPFSQTQRQQLAAWYGRHDAVQIQPVYLLQTRQPAQLVDILAVRRLRRHVTRQISPRHAIVAPSLIPGLRLRLRAAGIPLLAADPVPAPPAESAADPATLWLGQRVLAEIGRLLPLSIPPDHHTEDALAAQLTPAQRAEAERYAGQIIAALRTAVRGGDPFYPAERPCDPALLAAIETAFAAEDTLEIAYQGLGDEQPRWREVQPLRLETRGALTYLHAYCYTAVADRLFRLDRVLDWRPVGAA